MTMSRTVFKYTLTPGLCEIEMPEFAEPLCVAAQGNDVCIWAKVDPSKILVTRRFYSQATGAPIPDDLTLRYIGTAHGVEGWMVFHVFEVQGQ